MSENNYQEMATEVSYSEKEMADTDKNMASSSKSADVLDFEQIIPDPNQGRAEFDENNISALAESIKQHGLITPIIVIETKNQNGKYKIVDGERRYKAIKKLIEEYPNDTEYKSVPVSFINKDDPIYGYIANMARQVYNPIESAEALQYMQKHGKYTHEQLGKLVEKSRSTVSEYLNLLTLPKEILEKAKKESYVPLRTLKRIAASNKSDQEKITDYKKVHAQYNPQKAVKARKKDAKSAWDANRLAGGLKKKVEKLMTDFTKINVNEINNTESKEELREALENLLEKINEIKKGLGTE